MRTSDIFSTTTKYTMLENRFTASLVYLLRYLWDKSNGDQEQEQRRTLCRFLTEFCHAPFGMDQDIAFEVQKPELADEAEDNSGTVIPDFQIRSDSVLVWVEVKDTSRLTQDLRKYKRALETKAGPERENVLLLLRNRHYSDIECAGADHRPCWYELHMGLQEMAHSSAFAEGSISHYLLNEFLRYLKQKGVPAVPKIDREHLRGLPSLMSLLVVMRKEAEGIFQDLSVSEPIFYDDERYAYAEYDLRKSDRKGTAYLMQLWVPTASQTDPIEVALVTRREWLEPRQIMIAKDNSPFFTDGDYIYLTRSLNSALEKETVGEQSRSIGVLLGEMYSQMQEAIL